MHPQTLLVLVAAPLALACKCISRADINKGELLGVTVIECCHKYKGHIDTWPELDCRASTIKDHLNDFWHCCDKHLGVSDCYHVEDAAESLGEQEEKEKEA